MRKFYIFFALAFSINTSMSFIASANTHSLDKVQYHSHADIQKTVSEFVEQNLHKTENIQIKTTISTLDSRLKLAKCELPLTAFTASDINRNRKFSVGVKCNGIKPWSLYLTINVQKFAQVYISTSPLSRGEIIDENSITKVTRDISKLRRRFYSNKNNLIGMVVKRSLSAGTIFSKKYLTPPITIKKGDSVDIIAKTSALTIRMSGQAMMNGVKGQRIRVKNISSKRIIDAVVIDSGLVSVRI